MVSRLVRNFCCGVVIAAGLSGCGPMPVASPSTTSTRMEVNKAESRTPDEIRATIQEHTR